MTKDAAIGVIKRALDKELLNYQKHITNLRQTWTSDAGKIYFEYNRLKCTVDIYCSNVQVALNASLPFALIIFKRKIEDAVRSRLVNLFSSH